MAAYTAGQVSISNGSKAVVINSDENPESVAKGDFLFLSGSDPKEINRTYINDQQKHVIELIENWDSGNKTNQPAIVLPTTVEFRDTIAAIKNANLLINDNMQAMSDWQSKLGTVTFIGLDGTERTVPTLASFLATLGTAATKDVTTSPTDTTAGRLLTVGYGGLGGGRIDKAVYGDDLLSLMQAGDEFSGMLLEVASATTANKPDIAISTLAGIAHKISGIYLTVYATYPLAERGNIYTGYYDGAAIVWRKIYDSGNTNFNEFGGLAAGDYIGSVTFRNNGAARFYRDLSGWVSAPPSISVVGTFKIVNRGSDSDVITGIPASDVLYSSNTSNCELIVNIANINGTLLNPNLEYVLATETAESKITPVG